MILDKPVIFFDGECNLCNGFVDLLLYFDRDHKFYLAPLQGETAQQYLPPLPPNPQTWSIAYLHGENISFASDAVIAIAQTLGGPLAAIALTKPLPQVWRDALYRLVATNRYHFFGKRNCRRTDEVQESSFLP